MFDLELIIFRCFLKLIDSYYLYRNENMAQGQNQLMVGGSANVGMIS
jgi:hypothetical protein